MRLAGSRGADPRALTWRWVLVAWCVVLVAGCAMPVRIKEASRRQGELLVEFQKTVGLRRSRLVEYYDGRIEEFRERLIEAKRQGLQRP